MPLPAIVFGAAALLVVLGAVAIVLNAVRRSREGSAAIEERGWTRLPDSRDVVSGWDGWPFVDAKKPGRATDVVTGEVAGVEFLCLRWSQVEARPGDDDAERYNIVALRCELPLPHLSVVRGAHRVRAGQLGPETGEVETGDARFDRRWQVCSATPTSPASCSSPRSARSWTRPTAVPG